MPLGRSAFRPMVRCLRSGSMRSSSASPTCTMSPAAAFTSIATLRDLLRKPDLDSLGRFLHRRSGLGKRTIELGMCRDASACHERKEERGGSERDEGPEIHGNRLLPTVGPILLPGPFRHGGDAKRSGNRYPGLISKSDASSEFRFGFRAEQCRRAIRQSPSAGSRNRDSWAYRNCSCQ